MTYFKIKSHQDGVTIYRQWSDFDMLTIEHALTTVGVVEPMIDDEIAMKQAELALEWDDAWTRARARARAEPSALLIEKPKEETIHRGTEDMTTIVESPKELSDLLQEGLEQLFADYIQSISADICYQSDDIMLATMLLVASDGQQYTLHIFPKKSPVKTPSALMLEKTKEEIIKENTQ